VRLPAKKACTASWTACSLSPLQATVVALAVQLLAQQHGQWLLPMELRKAAVDELPSLFSHIGQTVSLLQPAGTIKTTPASSSSSSSSRASDVRADPESAAMSQLSCMCYRYAGISGSIKGLTVGAGQQHACGAHPVRWWCGGVATSCSAPAELLEHAVRSTSSKALPRLPALLCTLLRPGSVWSEAAVAGASAILSAERR
jgi:hypothetical protein